MESLLKSLPAILTAASGSAEVAEAACKAAWKQAVGETLSLHAQPIRLESKKLIVGVADNAWQRQLQQMCAQLLFRLNAVLGQPVVKLIEITVTPEIFALPRAQTTRPTDSSAAVPFELLAAAAEIQDADLRRAFLGAAKSCVK